jgi:hypothetical protein
MSTLRVGLLGSLLLASLAVAAPARAGDTDDTVFLKNGGRVRGTVMTEDPKQGVKVKLADGTVKTVGAAEVDHVDYGGAAAAAPPPPATPEPAPATPPPPAAAPPAAPPPAFPPPAAAPPAGDSAPATWQHDHLGFGVGAEFGVANADVDHDGTGLWLGVHGAVDIPLSRRFYLRADPSIVLHTASAKHYDSQQNSSGTWEYGDAKDDFTMTLLMVRAMAGFDINPMFTVRAGGFVGFGNGTVTTTFNGNNMCPSDSAAGPAGGGSLAAAMRLGARRNQELTVAGDAGIIPAPHCRRYSTSSPYYKANDDNPGLTFNLQYVYMWW